MNAERAETVTDAEHIAFVLLGVAGVNQPTQEQLTDMAVQWMRHTKAQREQIKFLEDKAAGLERENFALAAHQCTKGLATESGDFQCCCQIN